MFREGKQACCAQLSLLCIYYCGVYLPGASSFSKPNNSDPVVYLCRAIKVTPTVKWRKATQKPGLESRPVLGVAAKLFPALGITFQAWEHKASQLWSDLCAQETQILFSHDSSSGILFLPGQTESPNCGETSEEIEAGGRRERLERKVSRADGRQ